MDESFILSELLSTSSKSITLGTERIKQALAYLNNPQDKYKVIHITGSNGKGSTAAFIEVGLRQAGFRVGKYTSPYIISLYETITINGRPIDNRQLIEIFIIVDEIRRKHFISLSPFELLTVVMFEYCARQRVDYLVLEVGMGGLNDATNVVCEPIYSIITNVSLEHTAWFGSSLTAIAREKCGIIKNQSVVIADDSESLVKEVERKTKYYTNVLNKYCYKVFLDWNNFTTVVELNNNKRYTLSLFGKFQANNFLCAYEVLHGLGVSNTDISLAVSSCILPGRLQLVAHDPRILVGVTHNAGGAKVLYETLKDSYNEDDIVIIASILKDKDIPTILSYFRKCANAIIFTSITATDRGLSAQELLSVAALTSSRENWRLFKAMETLSAAVSFAKSLQRKIIIITGSFYLLQEYFALEQKNI